MALFEFFDDLWQTSEEMFAPIRRPVEKWIAPIVVPILVFVADTLLCVYRFLYNVVADHYMLWTSCVVPIFHNVTDALEREYRIRSGDSNQEEEEEEEESDDDDNWKMVHDEKEDAKEEEEEEEEKEEEEPNIVRSDEEEEYLKEEELALPYIFQAAIVDFRREPTFHHTLVVLAFACGIGFVPYLIAEIVPMFTNVLTAILTNDILERLLTAMLEFLIERVVDIVDVLAWFVPWIGSLCSMMLLFVTPPLIYFWNSEDMRVMRMILQLKARMVWLVDFLIDICKSLHQVASQLVVVLYQLVHGIDLMWRRLDDTYTECMETYEPAFIKARHENDGFILLPEDIKEAYESLGVTYPECLDVQWWPRFKILSFYACVVVVPVFVIPMAVSLLWSMSTQTLSIFLAIFAGVYIVHRLDWVST